MIKILFGKDEFTIYEKVKQMREDLRPKELRDVNTVVLDGSKITKDELVSVASVVPFMADSRLVIVEGLAGKFEGARRRSQRVLGDWENISKELVFLPSSTELVFKEGDIRRGNPMLRVLKEVGKVESYPALSFNQLLEWIRDRAAAQEMRIEVPAARLLADSVGSELRVINSELNKLDLYSDGSVITRQHVESLVAYVKSQSIFTVVDRSLAGEYREALEAANRLQETGLPPAAIIRMIARQVKLVIRVHAMRRNNESGSDISRRLSITGYPLQKTLEMERRTKFEEMVRVHKLILDGEVKVREGKLSEATSLTNLVIEMAVNKKF